MRELIRAFTALDRIDLILADQGPSQILHRTLGDALAFLPCVAEFAAIRWKWWHQRKEELVHGLPLEHHVNILRQTLPRFRRDGGYAGTSLMNSTSASNGEICSVPCLGKGWDAGDAFPMFQNRFKDIMVRRGISSKFAFELAGALDEIAGNAAEHAESPVLASACYQFFDTFFVFSVTDVGHGILSSLRQNDMYKGTDSDASALLLAMTDGVSCTGVTGRGHGFSYVFKKLVDHSCVLRFRSVSTSASWEGKGLAAQKLALSALPERVGFHICIAVPFTRLGSTP